MNGKSEDDTTVENASVYLGRRYYFVFDELDVVSDPRNLHSEAPRKGDVHTTR